MPPTQEELQKTMKQALGDLPTKKDHETLQNIVYFCLVVVVIGFIAIVIAYLSNTSQNISDEIQTQNTKMDALTQIDTQILLKLK